MKRFMIGLMVVVLAFPAFATTYYVTDGYFGTKTIENNDTLIMTGGGGLNLTGLGNSVLDIRNTSSPYVNGVSGLADIILGDNSQLYISGGTVHLLDLFSNTTVVLAGGQIGIINSYYVYPIDTSRITVYCQKGWTYTGGYLSGLWCNGSAFNIKLVAASGSDTFSNMTIIPEPATLLLLAVGGLLLKRKK